MCHRFLQHSGGDALPQRWGQLPRDSQLCFLKSESPFGRNKAFLPTVSTRLHLHIKSYYHINCGVIQGFPALRKAITTQVKKYHIFHVCWYSQSAAETSLAFGATRSGWWMNGKAFTILNTSCLSELSRIMAAKTLKNPYRWQTVRFKLF